MGLVFTFLGGMILLFIIAPLMGLYFQSSLPELAQVAAESEVQQSIWLTICSAMGATLIISVAAIPFSYILAKRPIPFKNLINAIIDIPVVIPHSAAGIAILAVISRGSLLGQWAQKIGISLVGTQIGIMIAMAFVSLPFLINSARDGFMAVPDRLEKAALNLGASPFRVFCTVSLPLAIRPILSGLVLMCARGMSEFGAVIIITYHPMITPIMIFDRFSNYGLAYSRSVTILFVSICLLFFIILKMIYWRKSDVGR